MAHIFRFAVICLSYGVVCADGLDSSRDWFDSKLSIDAGHIVHGKDANDLTLKPLNRNTVSLSQDGKFGDHWELMAGLEAIIWWPFNAGSSEPEKRTIRVEPRLAIAKAKLNLFPEADRGYLELGYFPYKYNPDAQNLGEYLYRSSTYPGVIKTTDGFHLLDHAVYDAYGSHLHFSLFNGLIGQEFTLFLEPSAVPVLDLTPGYELSLAWGKIRLGAGLAYNRLLSFAPRKTAPKELENAYIEFDSAGVLLSKPFLAAPDSTQRKIKNNDSTAPYRILHYWSQSGVKLMGNLALDLGFLIPEHLRSPGDLHLYTEVAVLGWENQPYFYEKRNQRIPIMLGVNFPTFRLLDRISVQTEYYPSRFDDSYLFNYYSRPVWGSQSFDYATYNPANFRRDDWKWSLYARKTLGRLIRVHAQIANDHLKLPAFNTQLSEVDLTRTPGHWYYLVRLEVGG